MAELPPRVDSELASPATAGPVTILSLPKEVRILIFRHILTGAEVTFDGAYWMRTDTPKPEGRFNAFQITEHIAAFRNIGLTCKCLHKEARDIFWEETRLNADGNYIDFLCRNHQHFCKSQRHVPAQRFV